MMTLVYNTKNQINFKTIMLKSNLWDCSDAYIFIKGTISAEKTAVQLQVIMIKKQYLKIVLHLLIS